MTNDRQTKLEELLAHQQHAIDTLNSEISNQRIELDELRRTVEKLTEKTQLLAGYVERMGEDLPHERPPHY